MKTLQIISTAMMMTYTMNALSNEKANETLSINILEVKSPTCYGANDGSVSVDVSGGEAPYTYDWNTFPSQKTAIAVNLSPGVYFIEVTDANGEKQFRSIEVTGPESAITSDNILASGPDNSLALEVGGTTAPYTYEFDGETLEEPFINDLSVGVHKLRVTDANNCTMVQFIQVFEVSAEEPDDGNYGWNKSNTDNQSENPIKIQISQLVPESQLDNISDQPEKDNLVTTSGH